nr:hypothetical protein [Candidatus Palauibacterales bacterium]
VLGLPLAVRGLRNPGEASIGLAGADGRWRGVGGAAIEGRRGRRYGIGVKEGEGGGGMTR